MSPTRDHNYYSDCGIVLQVENVLFKIDISLLATHSEIFKSMISVPAGPNTVEGTSDANPIVLPQVKPDEFRDLLRVFYSSPVDPEHIAFMYGSAEKKDQNPAAFKRYLNIARLAHRYCMSNTETWAKDQVRALVVLNLTSDEVWIDTGDLLEAHHYARLWTDDSDDTLAENIRHVFSYALDACYFSTVMDFYKASRDQEPVMRGIILARVLQIKPTLRSLELSWAEHAPLYALQVHLTPLPDYTPFSTLAAASRIETTLVDEQESDIELCPQIADCLQDHWERIVSDNWEGGDFEDAVREINDLHEARRSIVQDDRIKHCGCEHSDCGTAIVKHIDTLMKELFIEISDICTKVSGWPTKMLTNA
ncbi:The BTB (BR-C, ttk and bab)/POZ (Pox virus and Zinc finger) domain [Ceratobasidium sp. AG-Ba]|nr:The BTB (BR-C, ttk and bab)/POZ (Pox virus and Zinc finger) domain [Ceratobasidium sp. AG-Ba]